MPLLLCLFQLLWGHFLAVFVEFDELREKDHHAALADRMAVFWRLYETVALGHRFNRRDVATGTQLRF